MLSIIGFIVACLGALCLLGVIFFGLGYAMGMGMIASLKEDFEIKITPLPEAPTEDESNG